MSEEQHINLCIDQGNSSTKVGIFHNDYLIEDFATAKLTISGLTKIFDKYNVHSCILSSVVTRNEEITKHLTNRCVSFIELTHLTPIPVKNNYLTPETLGKDRLAAVIGASFLKPESDLLVIDAGTAITYDFVDSMGVYHGGNIAPGIEMRLRALHEFTSKLPLVEAKTGSSLLGNDTDSAILSGVLHGIEFEINGYFDALKFKYPELSLFLTGGSTFYFDTKLKNPIFAEKNLVLIGLNRILQYNVQK